jgi:hypothetical protein
MPELRLGLNRAFGWTSHPIMLGLAYAAFAAPAVTLYLQRRRGASMHWVAPTFILLGVFFSLSTGSWFAALIALLLILWDRQGPRNAIRRWKMAALLILVGYIGLEIFADAPPLLALMYHIRFLSTGWLYRWQLWERVMGVMPGHLLFGYGDRMPLEFSGPVGWSVDNHYLVIMLSQGWFGLSTWLLFNISVLWQNIKWHWLKKNNGYSQLSRSFAFSVIGFLVSGLTVAFFSTGAVMLYLAIGIAACKAPESMLQRKKPAQRIVIH